MDSKYRDAINIASGESVQFFKRIIGKRIQVFDKRNEDGILKRLFTKAKRTMDRSGYTKPYARYIYLFFKVLVPAFIFFVTWAVNFPSVIRPIVAAICFMVPFELILKSNRKKIKLSFQKNAYKIYKYLHNQISSGIKVTDAVKTAYEVIEDRDLKERLLRLSARYDLTLDMDKCLDEFEQRMDSEDAGALCTAIKLGIETGDNSELLARQEDIMFKKYFNFIQAETEACKGRSLIAASLFTLIIVILLAVPLFINVSESMGKIFAY